MDLGQTFALMGAGFAVYYLAGLALVSRRMVTRMVERQITAYVRNVGEMPHAGRVAEWRREKSFEVLFTTVLWLPWLAVVGVIDWLEKAPRGPQENRIYTAQLELDLEKAQREIERLARREKP